MLWMYGLCTYMKGEQLLKEPFQRGYTQSIPTFFQVFMGLIIKGPPSQAYIQGEMAWSLYPGWISYTHLGCVSTSFSRTSIYDKTSRPRCGALKNMVDFFLDGGWGGAP